MRHISSNQGIIKTQPCGLAGISRNTLHQVRDLKITALNPKIFPKRPNITDKGCQAFGEYGDRMCSLRLHRQKSSEI